MCPLRNYSNLEHFILLKAVEINTPEDANTTGAKYFQRDCLFICLLLLFLHGIRQRTALQNKNESEVQSAIPISLLREEALPRCYSIWTQCNSLQSRIQPSMMCERKKAQFLPRGKLPEDTQGSH